MDPLYAPTIFPRHWNGVRRINGKWRGKIEACVFDTETFYGKVFAAGFKSERAERYCHGLATDSLGWLLDQLVLFVRQSHVKSVLIASAHYVKYDLGVLFWEVLHANYRGNYPAPRVSRFSLLSHRVSIEIFWTRPCFGIFIFHNLGGRRVRIIDSFAFYPMSLGDALNAIGAKEAKLGKPSGLGKRIIPSKELRPYLEGDIRGVYVLIQKIVEWHRKYETRLCVSLPMLAGRIFRHFYMRRDFVRPPRDLIFDAMLSYHGGKNNFRGEEGWYKNVWDLDINSAFSEAMRQLPDFSRGRWKYVDSIRPSEIVGNELAGIFRGVGKLGPCEWGSLYTHSFKQGRGAFDGFVTGYELRESILSGEFTPEKISGWVFYPQDTHKGISCQEFTPWAKFVDHFFHEKLNAKTPGERLFFKLLLNASYGKYVQRTQDEQGNYIAGSMFDPAIASLVTGYVRARIHRLEHKYNALHTATDGILTQVRPDPVDVGPGLGQLKIGNFGPCLILRNKLYLHYDEKGVLKKSGLHGFEGTPDELLDLWNSARRTYKIERLVSWAESWHIRLPPGGPISRDRILRTKSERLKSALSLPL